MSFEISGIQNEQIKAKAKEYSDDGGLTLSDEKLSLFLDECIISEQGIFHDKATLFDRDNNGLNQKEAKAYLRSDNASDTFEMAGKDQKKDDVSADLFEDPESQNENKTKSSDKEENVDLAGKDKKQDNVSADLFEDPESQAEDKTKSPDKEEKVDLANKDKKQDDISADLFEDPKPQAEDKTKSPDKEEKVDLANKDKKQDDISADLFEDPKPQNENKTKFPEEEDNKEEIVVNNNGTVTITKEQYDELMARIQQQNNNKSEEVETVTLTREQLDALINGQQTVDPNNNKTVAETETEPNSETKPVEKSKPEPVEINWASTSQINQSEKRVFLQKIEYHLSLSSQDLSTLPEFLRNDASAEKYKYVIKTIEDIVNNVQAADCNSKADIKKLKAQLTKGQRIDDIHNKFYNDILNLIIAEAEKDQISKETTEIIKKYNELKSEMTKGEDKEINFTNLYERTINSGVVRKDSYGKQAVQAFKKTWFKNDRINTVLKDINENTTDETSLVGDGLKVRNTARKKHREKVGADKYYYNTVTYHTRTESGIIGRDNKANHRQEELKHIGEEELKSKLKVFVKSDKKTTTGKSSSHKSSVLSDDLFALIGSNGYLEKHKNEDGTYDLSNLSTICKLYVGADVLGNRSKDKETSELKNLRDALALELGLENPKELTTDDAKKIMKLCGIKMEPKERKIINLFKALATGFVGGGLGGAAVLNFGAGAVSYSQSYDLWDVIEMVACQEKGLEGGKAAVEELKIALNKAGIEELTGGMSQNISVVANLLPAALRSACVAALFALAIDSIFGQEQSFEKSCITIQDILEQNQNITDFGRKMRTKYGEDKAAKLVELAKLFADENGNIDVLEMHNMFAKIAGPGSNLNPRECKAFMLERTKEKTKPELPEETFGKAQYVQTVEAKAPVIQKQNVEFKIPTIDARSSTWTKMTSFYDDCLQGMSLSKKIRILKLVQAITDNDYSLERLNRLYEKSLKGSKNLKDEPGFDCDTYYNMLISDTLPKNFKIPEKIGYNKEEFDEACDRKDITKDNIKVKLTVKQLKDKDVKVNKGATGVTGSVEREVVVDPGHPGGEVPFYFAYMPRNGGFVSYNQDSIARNTALDNYKLQNPKARLVDYGSDVERMKKQEAENAKKRKEAEEKAKKTK